MSIKTRTSGIMVNINVEPATGGGWQGVTSGLTHHWPLDDANVTGVTIIDIVAGLNATATGAGITSATGPNGSAGTARQFDGVDTASMASNVFTNMNANDSTLCAWIFCPDVTVNGPDGNDPMWLNVSDGTNGTSVGVIPGVSPAMVSLGTVTNNEPGGDIPNSLTNNAWAHVAWTHPGGTIVTGTNLYFNGSFIGTASPPTASSGTTNIFGGRQSINHRLLNGSRLGRVITYDRVLSAAEILQNFNAK